MNSSNKLSQSESDWQLSLDLLIARAALDQSLRSELLLNPKKCCSANGILIPDEIQLVFTDADQELLIREIPTNSSDSSIDKCETISPMNEPAYANYNETSKEVAVTAYEAVQAVEFVEVAEDVAAGTTVAGEAEAVVVAVAVVI